MNAENQVVHAWRGQGSGWSPLPALKTAGETLWIVDGVIPADSIVWVAGSPTCGKTFAFMGLSVKVSQGQPWQGRQCDQMPVIFVAAEGGTDIHVRRAAAELAAGAAGPILVQQTRPQIAEPEGLAELMSLVQAVTGGSRGVCNSGIYFNQVSDVDDEVWDDNRKYLKPEELQRFKNPERLAELVDAKESGERLSLHETKELEALNKELSEQDRDLEALEEWARGLAATRLKPLQKAAYKYQSEADYVAACGSAGAKKVLLIIDTYSWTAADDSKVVVSRYLKNLRELMEQAEKVGGSITVVVIDHFTKSGESFMGALAKQGDSDVMIEVERHGQLVTLSCPEKMKTAKPFDPIHLELVPFSLAGFNDARGRPLASQVTRDGESVHKSRKAAGTQEENAAAVMVQLLTDQGACEKDVLRALFLAHPFNEGKKTDSAKRAFRRALEDLAYDGMATDTDGMISLCSSEPGVT